jgi:D-beta-D-heptose 7-phosphate kinase/D-beta-D-heptose 1-phosphate adenosyltransferase
MKEKIEDLISNFRNLKVLVIGDAILDTYTKGSTDRICREAPVVVLNVHEREYQCGGAANTAINVAALGAETYFLTVLGKDAHAQELLTVLRKRKVHTEYILRDKTRTTIAKQRIMANSNILLRTDEGTEGDITENNTKALLERVGQLYPQTDAIILSDYGYGVLTNEVIAALKKLHLSAKTPLIVDAKDLNKYQALQPTAVKPNFQETLTLLGMQKLPGHDRVEQFMKMGPQLLSLSGAQKVAVTLDIDGVLLFEHEQEPHHVPCTPRDQTKTIGAGDTFTSALTLALASHTNGKTAVEIAAAAAAVVVQKTETAVCTNSELIACFTPETKLTTLKHLVKLVKEWKQQHKKIVFTNGCFDILHKGHIALLNQAREAGDVLIVGVNSDESIRALKGPDRPINSLEDRITVLAGLQSVDYLVSFSEESPAHLIQALKPDIFVKGANYTESSLPEGPLLKKLGCEVTIVPLVEDHSTTYLINKILHSRKDEVRSRKYEV